MNRSGKRSSRPQRERSVGKGMLAFIFLLVLLVGVGLASVIHNYGFTLFQKAPSSSVPVPVSEPEPEPQPVVTTLRVSASGDDLIHDGLYLMASRAAGGDGYDFAPLYAQVADFYRGFDFNWVNQETLVSDEISPSGYPCFCTPGAVAHALYDLGFRVFASSNNHSYDQGAAGIQSTLDFWASMPEDTVEFGYYRGEADYSNITVQDEKGVRIAYVAYTEMTNGIPTPANAAANVIYTSQTDVIQQQLAAAHTMADVVIACVHWGTENSHEVNDAQRTLAQQMADWGADLILGTHPHVVQAIEQLTSADGRTVPVYYSLGNFVSLQMQADNLVGIAATFTIAKTTQPDGTSNTQIGEIGAVPLVMYYDGGYTVGQVYLLRDYTDALAAAHANKAVTPTFATQLVQQYISAEYLQLS